MREQAPLSADPPLPPEFSGLLRLARRSGYAPLSVEVLPGVDNFGVVRLDSAGRIVGRVLDAAGNPVPRTKIAIPEENGFSWVEADENGNYQFENLALKKYDLTLTVPPAEK